MRPCQNRVQIEETFRHRERKDREIIILAFLRRKKNGGNSGKKMRISLLASRRSRINVVIIGDVLN